MIEYIRVKLIVGKWHDIEYYTKFRVVDVRPEIEEDFGWSGSRICELIPQNADLCSNNMYNHHGEYYELWRTKFELEDEEGEDRFVYGDYIAVRLTEEEKMKKTFKFKNDYREYLAGVPTTIRTIRGEEKTITPAGKFVSGEEWSAEVWEQYLRAQEADLWNAETSHEYIESVKHIYKQTQEGTANKDNFMWNTAAVFQKQPKRPRRKPDYVSKTRDGKVSSEYWYTEEGVIRGSSHWGIDIASCDWGISSVKGSAYEITRTSKLYGFAKWSDFTQKTESVRVNGKEIGQTTFANTKGKDTCMIGGKTYFYNNWGWQEWEEI